jgi:hypothetical protein
MRTFFGRSMLVILFLVGLLPALSAASWPDKEKYKFFNDDAGKSLFIDYASAMTLKPDSEKSDFEAALKFLSAQIVRESLQGDDTPWTRKYARAMAQIVKDADARKLELELTATECFYVARGFLLLSNEQYKKYLEMIVNP